MEFSDKLKKLRIENNMTQQELADQLFISRSAVAKWENGLGMPSADSLAKICAIFNVQEQDILSNNLEEENVKKNHKILSLKRTIIIGLILTIIYTIVIIVIWNTHPQKILMKYKLAAPEAKLNGTTCNLVDDKYLYYIYDETKPAGFKLRYKVESAGVVPIYSSRLKVDEIKKSNVVNQDTKYLLDADNILWEHSSIHVNFEYLDDNYKFLSKYMVFEEYDYYKYIVFNENTHSASFPIDIDYDNHMINIPYKTKYMMLISISAMFKLYVQEIDKYEYTSFYYHFLAK